jgi:hypothetical protein
MLRDIVTMYFVTTLYLSVSGVSRGSAGTP